MDKYLLTSSQVGVFLLMFDAQHVQMFVTTAPVVSECNMKAEQLYTEDIERQTERDRER